MTWIIIVVVLLVAFGPVFWLVPSRKDKRLAALRSRARADGLLVDIRRLPKLNPNPEDRVSAGGRVREPTVECAAYGRMFARKLRYLPGWRILRAPPEGEPDPFADWQYDQRPTGEGRAYLGAMLPLVRTALDRLSDDVIGFEVEPRGTFAYWLEKPGSTVETVGELASTLADLEADLTALDTRLAPRSPDIDS